MLFQACFSCFFILLAFVYTFFVNTIFIAHLWAELGTKNSFLASPLNPRKGQIAYLSSLGPKCRNPLVRLPFMPHCHLLAKSTYFSG